MNRFTKFLACSMMTCTIFAGCGGSGEPEEIKTEFKQDETATFKNVEFKVLSVEKFAAVEYETPKEGCEYVMVNIEIHNKSDEKITYNPYDWKMENSQGQELDQAFVIFDSDTHLSNGDLKTDGTVSGTIVFEQPAGDTGLKLNYYNNSLFDEEPSISFVIA